MKWSRQQNKFFKNEAINHWLDETQAEWNEFEAACLEAAYDLWCDLECFEPPAREQKDITSRANELIETAFASWRSRNPGLPENAFPNKMWFLGESTKKCA